MTDTQAASGIETWTIDPTHSSVEFKVKHMMITTVKGRFGQVEGSIQLGGEENVLVDVRIDAASIDTRTEQRDDHLRSADFLDVENYPELTFRSHRVEGSFDAPGDEFKIFGDLTIRGTTREVVLEAEYEGTTTDPWGGTRKSFTAKGKFDRTDFGLTWNQAMEAGGVLVSNEMKVEIDIQVVRQD